MDNAAVVQEPSGCTGLTAVMGRMGPIGLMGRWAIDVLSNKFNLSHHSDSFFSTNCLGSDRADVYSKGRLGVIVDG